MVAFADFGAEGEDFGDFVEDGFGVFEGECGGAAPAAAHAAAGVAAGEDGDDVLAEGGDFIFDLFGGAGGDADGGDDGADADDDAEHGEEGAHFVAAQGEGGEADGGE